MTTSAALHPFTYRTLRLPAWIVGAILSKRKLLKLKIIMTGQSYVSSSIVRDYIVTISVSSGTIYIKLPLYGID